MEYIQKNKAVFMLLLSAILWSSGGIIIKNVSLSPSMIACLRSLFATVLILPILLLSKTKINFDKTTLLGAVFYACTISLFVYSNKYTTAANAILLQYTAPIYVAFLGALFLHERTRAKDWIFMFFAFVGVVMFFMDDLSYGMLIGNVMGLLSGLTFALLTITLRKQKNGKPEVVILLGNILCAILHSPAFFYEAPAGSNILWCGFLGIFQLGLPYFMFSLALKKVKALDAVLIPMIEPVLSPVWVFLFIGEIPGKMAIIGGAIVIASTFIRNMGRKNI